MSKCRDVGAGNAKSVDDPREKHLSNLSNYKFMTIVDSFVIINRSTSIVPSKYLQIKSIPKQKQIYSTSLSSSHNTKRSTEKV